MATSIRPDSDVPFEIAREDEGFLVVNKPAGVVTEPGKKHAHDSLLNGLFVEYGRLLQNLGERRDWGLLHRLDKDTSGLVLIALSIRAYEALLDQFKRRHIHKLYWAIVAGRPSPAQGVVQQPLAEVIAGGRKRVIGRRDGHQAITAYRVLQSSDKVSLVEARPKTGRLHQIRAHMASLNCPVLGDETYGPRDTSATVPRLCLHSASLSLVHPDRPERIEVRAPWPADLAKTIKRLGLSEP